MYAIRSYYVAAHPDHEIVFPVPCAIKSTASKLGASAVKNIELVTQVVAIATQEIVITSYSIHYTKLYDILATVSTTTATRWFVLSKCDYKVVIEFY